MDDVVQGPATVRLMDGSVYMAARVIERGGMVVAPQARRRTGRVDGETVWSEPLDHAWSSAVVEWVRSGEPGPVAA